jgi:hypothetical protein
MGSGTLFNLIGSTADLTYEHSFLNPPGITMQYRVAAVNDIGQGPQTSSVSIILGTVPGQPGAPSRIEATQTSITVGWSAPDDGGSPITHYHIMINSGSGSTFIVAGETTNRQF